MSLSKNCFTDLPSDQQQYAIYNALNQIIGFDIPAYDDIAITYYGSTNNIQTVTYSNNGSPVAVLTLTYATQPPVADDTNLTGVAIS